MNYSMFIIFLSILTFLSFNINTSCATSSVEKLCNKTRDPNLCTAVLRSDQRSRNASSLNLALIAVDLALANASATKAKIHSLYQSEVNLDFKSYYNACESNYEDALFALGHAREDLKQGNYHDANTLASEANNNAVYCEDALNSLPLEPPLTKENEGLQLLAEMIASATNMMPISSRRINAALKLFNPLDHGFRVLGVVALLLIVT